MSPPSDAAIVDPPIVDPAQAMSLSRSGDLFTSGEFRMTGVIFLFGLVAMVVFYLLLRLEKATPYTLRIFVIIILVFGTLLIVSSAYTTQQISPVVGLFGTIAGYLLGRSERSGGEG